MYYLNLKKNYICILTKNIDFRLVLDIDIDNMTFIFIFIIVMCLVKVVTMTRNNL